MSRDAEYEADKIIDKLVGAKIVGAATDESGEFFCMIVQKEGKKIKVWIDGDQEGNHCGALNIWSD